MARVLVIGGTLFIGRALVEQLLDRGDEVVVMHRGAETPFGKRVGEIRCDRNDVNVVKAALDGTRFDVIYDNVYDWKRSTSAEQVAAAATAAVKGLRRYVFTSSVAVYAPGGEYDEDAELVPSNYANPYGAKKADSERALFALFRERKFPVTTVRPAFIYGEHNPFEREAFFLDRIVAGRPVIVPDDGLSTLQFVYARDAARASTLAAESGAAVGRAYNLATFPPITQLDFVRLLGRVAGKPVDVIPVPRERLLKLGGGLFQPPYYFGAYLDVPPITVRSDRVQTELGFTFTSMEDGMRETFKWYARQERPKPDYSWEDKAIA